MDKRKWSKSWMERMGASLLLLVFSLSCGYLVQFTVDVPAAAFALASRATR